MGDGSEASPDGNIIALVVATRQQTLRPRHFHAEGFLFLRVIDDKQLARQQARRRSLRSLAVDGSF
ncbi:hypothetical protein D8I24_2874 (plasmid) [Cupriavidus necator H850]|nr:hypothetical protein D8I24_2874 [Cupriavidus necator H850]